MKHLLHFFLLAFFPSALMAQIEINVSVLGPYSSSYISYFDNPNTVNISIRNTTSENKSIYLAGSIRAITLDEMAFVPGDEPGATPPMIIPAGATLHYSGMDLQAFSDKNTVRFTDGISIEDVSKGTLPEGEYQICLQAHDYFLPDHPILSAGEPFGCSNIFSINSPSPPQLLFPICESYVDALLPQNVIFSWQQPIGIPMSSQIMYEFKLVYLPEGIDPVSAIESTSALDIVHYHETTSTSFIYGPDSPPLIRGRKYAWRIFAHDLNLQVNFQNDGISEPCTFTYLDENAAGGIYEVTFPITGDTLPWKTMPIVTRINSPELEFKEYHDFRSDLTLHLETNSDEFKRYLKWPNGPLQDQETAVDGSLTLEQARFIGLYRRNDEIATTGEFHNFTSGKSYSWDADVSVSSAGNINYGSVSGNFVSGMGKPQQRFPETNDTLYLADLFEGKIELAFKSSDAPQLLFPPYDVRQTKIHEDGAAFIDGFIDERIVSEIFTDETLNSPSSTFNHRIGNNLFLLPELHGGSTCRSGCVSDSIYKTFYHTFAPTTPGWYYWRVKWLENPELENGSAYLNSAVVKFYVASGSKPEKEEEEKPKGPCIASCEASEIPEEEQVSVSTARKDTIIHIGLFDLKITDISWSSVYGSGNGIIEIPFMHAPLKVKFENIKVNKKNRVYEGTVFGSYDNESIVPPNMVNAVAGITDFSQQQAENLNSFISGGNRLVSQMTMNSPMGLPLGIDQVIEGVRIIIGIVSMEFTPQRATLNAMTSVNIPDWNTNIGFGARNICFHPQGVGSFTGRDMLYLHEDLKFPIFGDSILIRGTKFEDDFNTVRDSGTFINWDCEGFQSLIFDGQVIFGKDHLVEDLPDGSVGPGKIRADFKYTASRSWQLMAKLNFNKPFQISGAEGWGFEVTEAWYDHSEMANPTGVVFPVDYGSFYDPAQNKLIVTNDWKGFYLKQATLRLPKDYKVFDGESRISAGIENLIIDGDGVTGGIRLYNIFDVNRGNLGGWGYSMDTLLVDITKNSFARAGFIGEVRIPITDTLLRYSSIISMTGGFGEAKHLEYQFRIFPKDSLNAPLWRASELHLSETSNVTITFGTEGTPAARAELTGDISFNFVDDQVGRINFKAVEFQGIAFQSRSPYYEKGAHGGFHLNSPAKFLGGGSLETDTIIPAGNTGGFPVNLTKLDLAYKNGSDGPMLGLEIGLSLSLSGTETNTFTASTEITIFGKINIDGEASQHWEYDHLQFDSVGLKGSVGIVSLIGGLRFYYDDPVYGDGIRGMIQAEFKPHIKVQVAGQFGNKSGVHYWFADAQAVFSPGIPMFPGLKAYGFGGGAWYHMKRTSSPPDAAHLVNADTTGKTYTPGLSLSGCIYKPDPNVALGFNASLVFGSVGDEDAFNGDVTFGMDFTNGGIDNLFLNGNGYFMCDIHERSNPQVHAELQMNFDFAQEIFTCQLRAFVNVKGGLMKGGYTEQQNLAGSGNIFISPETWSILVGTPQTPIKLTFLNLFNARSYLMLGENLPAIPDSIAGVLGSERTGISGGSGFAFGAGMFYKHDLDFLCFRFAMSAGLGFDISVLKRDQGCEGFTGLPGVDGWYAQGRMYGYFNGSMSIHVDFGITDGNYHMFTVGASAILSGGLPNPTWMKGTVGGNYSVLGGAISGHCTFNMSIGDKCEPPVTSVLNGLKIISDLIPVNKEGFPAPSGIHSPGSSAPLFGVDCGVNPLAAFDVPMNKDFYFTQTKSNGGQFQRRFRLVIEKFNITQNGISVATKMETAPNGRTASLAPDSFLTGEKIHVLTLRVRVEEYFFNEQIWKPGKRDDGSLVFEERIYQFKTDKAPDHITPENVQYSAPFHDQRFFLQDECPNGFLQLKSSQAYLFEGTHEGFERKFKALFIPINGGPVVERNLVPKWNESPGGIKRIYFEIPPLANNKTYLCQLISRDSTVINSFQVAESGNSGNNNVIMSGNMPTAMSSSSFTSSQQGNVNIRHTTIALRPIGKKEKLLYSFYFKTSKFNTLEDKAATLTPVSTGNSTFLGLVILLPNFNSEEQFDVFDINGFTMIPPRGARILVPPLVKLYDPRNDNWSKNYTDPLIYKYYRDLTPQYTPLKFTRAMPGERPDTVGIPPEGAVTFSSTCPRKQPLQAWEKGPQSTLGISTGPLSVSVGSGPVIQPADVQLKVSTPLITLLDYQNLYDLTFDAINRFGNPYGSEPFIGEPTITEMRNFLESDWVLPYRGQYGIRFFYRPPSMNCKGFYPSRGSDNGTSTISYTY